MAYYPSKRFQMASSAMGFPRQWYFSLAVGVQFVIAVCWPIAAEATSDGFFVRLSANAVSQKGMTRESKLVGGQHSCTVPSSYSLKNLSDLRELNCKRVKAAASQLQTIVSVSSPRKQLQWWQYGNMSIQDCHLSEMTSNPRRAAQLSVNAMTSITWGYQCCTHLTPPYCFLIDDPSRTHYLPMALCIAIVIALKLAPMLSAKFSAPTVWRISPIQVSSVSVSPAEAESDDGMHDSGVASVDGDGDPSLRSILGTPQYKAFVRELQAVWVGEKGSPLRVLPGATDFAIASAELFASLQILFGFQVDNVRNQFEHLLSLWRSHVATVADHAFSSSRAAVVVDEAALLRKGLRSLRGDLLEGFDSWQEKMQPCLQDETGQTRDARHTRAPIGGLAWPPRGISIDAVAAKHLSEVTVYLLVWGEGGNIRFMPELVHFLTELVLSSSAPLEDSQTLLASATAANVTALTRSGVFLTRVVRPIYNSIFEEHYVRVGIDVPLMEIKWIGGAGSSRERLLSGEHVRLKGTQVRFEKRQGSGKAPLRQSWAVEPAGFDKHGLRLVYVRWGADSKLSLHAAAASTSERQPSDGEVLLSLSPTVEGETAQLFHISDESRIVWAGGVHLESTTPPPLCLCAVGAQSDELSMKVLLKAVNEADPGQLISTQVCDKKSGKDVKELRPGFQAFLPADACNHDDWNELFDDPVRLRENLVFPDDATSFFDVASGNRLGALSRLVWRECLSKSKTHRELHSWWGIYASTYRMWMLHGTAYCVLIAFRAENFPVATDGGMPLCGRTLTTRLGSVGLMVPLNTVLLLLCLWFTAGVARRRALMRSLCTTCDIMMPFLISFLLLLAPCATYTFLRLSEEQLVGKHMSLTIQSAHFVVSGLGVVFLLCFPGMISLPNARPLTTVHPLKRVGRWLFWFTVFGVKLLTSRKIVDALYTATEQIDAPNILCASAGELLDSPLSPFWDTAIVQWVAIWSVGFVVFVADTQLWFVLGCTAIGMAVGFAQRDWRVDKLLLEDAVALIPKRLSEKVFPYDINPSTRQGRFSPYFPRIWDRIIAHFHYEDKISDHSAGEMSFFSESSHVGYKRLSSAIQTASAGSVTVPELFRERTAVERWLRRDAGILPDTDWPKSKEVQWRLMALGRGLSLKLPRPFRAPYLPGLTVLIPHYGETIVMNKGELLGSATEDLDRVPLLTWLEHRYEQEFTYFTSRMLQSFPGWPRHGSGWASYEDEDWEKICMWASMRNQTLWRTVAGMMLYHLSLDCHFKVQGDRSCALSQAWDSKDCFTCLVSMQMYVFFNTVQYEQTERLLRKFPASLKIAYIDFEETNSADSSCGLHPNQHRRYFSCLIDRNCGVDKSTGRRIPRFRVELPGFPILGDGKGDNQNHAIPFSRGAFIQCIDANQGGYFEQMLMLPCVLGEFRQPGGDNPHHTSGAAKRIVGFPEHITSDIGSIGDFAASAEFAFGTILQRAYAALGGRMHYGHPDMMSKAHMMQQGGVSKATKTVNLSEDIFAGMDFTLKGSRREIVHREYFHLTKGRDMGFSTVLQFFSKLSAGTGEVALTRQTFRLGQLLPLPEFLTFHYAHVGSYMTQLIIALCPQLLTSIWLLLLVNGPEDTFTAMEHEVGVSTAQTAEEMLNTCFSWLIILFIVAQGLPFIAEAWTQQGIVVSVTRYFKQMVTLAPLHFIFQSKVVGIYLHNELKRGGAQYIATGRGLPTERRPFVSRTAGLYTDFAMVAIQDGAFLLISMLMAVFLTWGYPGMRASLFWWLLSLSVTIISWLFAPFVFNPYQFASRYFHQDIERYVDFFKADGAICWVAWYEKTQLVASKGVRVSVFDFALECFWLAVWFCALGAKVNVYSMVFPSTFVQFMPFFPPIAASLVVTVVVLFIECRGVRVHPCIVSAIFIAVGVAETVFELVFLVRIGWWKSVVASLLFKQRVLSIALSCAEHMIRLAICPCPCVYGAVRIWLYGHRMAIDLIVSSFVFATLSLPVLFDVIRSSICEGCSLHQLLVFRSVGALGRTTEVIRFPHALSRSFLHHSVGDDQSPMPTTSETIHPTAALAPLDVPATPSMDAEGFEERLQPSIVQEIARAAA
eukprot:TRINITY_DN29664_c0_g2_i1.p1 TRINITY_DN29664_c0_g2~~TRINITY_DN29664_c0_g2_i1.p1  ORF type:complete len:2088 (+),score=251.91 TRINITY_DN29664_c0_g2_i1:26-6289(+)